MWSRHKISRRIHRLLMKWLLWSTRSGIRLRWMRFQRHLRPLDSYSLPLKIFRRHHLLILLLLSIIISKWIVIVRESRILVHNPSSIILHVIRIVRIKLGTSQKAWIWIKVTMLLIVIVVVVVVAHMGHVIRRS